MLAKLMSLPLTTNVGALGSGFRELELAPDRLGKRVVVSTVLRHILPLQLQEAVHAAAREQVLDE